MYNYSAHFWSAFYVKKPYSSRLTKLFLPLQQLAKKQWTKKWAWQKYLVTRLHLGERLGLEAQKMTCDVIIFSRIFSAFMYWVLLPKNVFGQKVKKCLGLFVCVAKA